MTESNELLSTEYHLDINGIVASPLVAPPSRPLAALHSCPLVVLSLRRPLAVSSRRLVVASPLVALPSRPLIAPPSRPLVVLSLRRPLFV